MATYMEIHTLRHSSLTLRARTSVACVKAAQDILNEDPGTANHAQRVLWANQALSDATAMAEKMLWGVVGNSTIQTSGDAATDNDLQFVVNGLIPVYMGGAS